MNFYTKSLYRHRPAMVKILLVMKMIVLLLTAAILQVSASTYGQNVTINQRNADLAKVIRELRKQTGFDFVYSNKMLEQAKPVNLNLNNVPFEVALEQCFKNQPLTFSITDKIVTIKEKAPTFLERVVATLIGIDVSGWIVDADGRGLPGASVSVKGKGKAVITRANGTFLLKGVDENAVLLVSFIGYVNKEVKAVANLGDVILELSTSKLDEVQVIAYGTTTQRLSTGNVTTIKADVIEKQPVNNPLLALQGRVPGLFIEQATGFAGTGVKVRIQGQNSSGFYSGNDPLYVVDGIPFVPQLLSGGNTILGSSGTTGIYGNPLSFISPSDIESVDVLKDADATSIYGSRAANGAILITTKKGKTGDTKVNLNLQSGAGRVSRRLDLMNSQEYLMMRSEAFNNDGINEPTPGPYGDSDLNGNWDNTRSTDWQKELIGGTARYQDINTSISGGANLTSFLVSASYHKEKSVFPGDFTNQKASMHFSLSNSSLNQKFKLQFSGGYMFDNNKLPNVDLTSSAMDLSPVAPSLYLQDGNINWGTDSSGASTFSANPIGYLYNDFSTKTSNLISNLSVSYQILSGLELKGNFGYNNLSSNAVNKSLKQQYYPELAQFVPRGTSFVDNLINSFTIEPQLTYTSRIGKGKVEALLGATVLQNNSKGSEILGSGFSNDLVMDDILSAAVVQAVSSTSSKYKYNALFGRLNYNWQDKYIINLSLRRDGSSRFGSANQFHNFYSGAAAWIFTNENLFKNNLMFLSFGKLRASYGITGSDQIGDYKTLNVYNPAPQEVPYQGIVAYKANGLTNPYLQWEETKKLQFGLDLAFIKDRIFINTTYYRNQSSNLLSPYNLPITTGFTNITINQQAKIRNSGWELLISGTGIQNKDFSWKTGVNLTIPKTLTVDYPDIVKSSASSNVIIGAPVSAKLVYHFLGVDPATGMYQFEDANGNPTTAPKDPVDKKVLIDLAPKFYGGFQNTFIFKRLELDILFSYVKQIAENYSYGTGAGIFNLGVGNQTSELLQRWQKPGDIASVQRFTTTNELDQSLADVYQSDARWSDGSYIRLKNVALSWQLPKSWIGAVRIENCSLYVQGQNLWTITGYSGLDPETKSSRTLPPLKVITFGIKLGL